MNNIIKRLRIKILQLLGFPELPDWTDERNIYVQAGLETCLKRENGIWYIKTGKCATAVFAQLGQGQPCGECCKRVPPTWKLGRTEEGYCIHYRGGANMNTCAVGWPYGCVTGDHADEAYCKVRWEVL